MKAIVLGTSGYTGSVLLRILSEHPEIDTIIPVSSSRAGEYVLEVDSGMGKDVLLKMSKTCGKFITLNEAIKLKADVVFAALPHLKSAELLSPFFGKSIIIDLSADFRMKDDRLFEKAYGCPPPRADLKASTIYGLCEWYKDKIKKYDIIANPGCYPTATLIPLMPLISKGIIGDKIVVNAISGISGAGKKVMEKNLYCERADNVCAYAPGKTHRHGFEIEGELKALDNGCMVFFTPHLAPLKRGILVTSLAFLKKKIDNEIIERVYTEYYVDCPFIFIKGNYIPQTRDVYGSNRCDIGWHIEGDHIIIFSVIDNLIKGASGQAVQNMNIRFGFDEQAGLKVDSEV